jgi:predicted lipoprotein with Yx(FWY)xxD motif/polyisoprenoid-binding protein YceI
MKVKHICTLGILILLMGTAVACGVLQEPEAASEPIEAVPLEIEATDPPPTEQPPTEIPPTETLVDDEEPEATAEPMEEPPVEEMSDPSLGLQIYQIVPTESSVRFELDEDLRGTRTTVIGTTDQLAGELALDLNDLASTQIGVIQINARTLATDNDFRNRAIKNEILNTNDYEFITFTPTAINNLPDSAALGESVSFSIIGDLTIQDITQEATFAVEATAVSENELTGTASTTVQRADYNLNIPSVPNVANVEEEVELYIDFIARSAGGGGEVSSTNAVTVAEEATLMLAEDDTLGTYITDAAGMALYTFANDTPGISNCYDRCATAWPPLLVEEGMAITAVDGIPGEINTTEREDGTLQVSYDGWPLYYWVNDEAPGDTTGHNVSNVWALAWPTTKVLLGGNDKLGRFLTGVDGMTLYRFNPDEPGLSNCYDQCAVNWPPLLVQAGEVPVAGFGVTGELGVTERQDETLQVTYDGMPLYYWIDDAAPGDTTGQGVNDVWFVVSP